MDLYQRLGISAARAKPRSRRRIAASPSSFIPTATRTIRKAAERFGEVTQAYDLLSDKDKRARYDRGEIDEDGNPKSPFGGGYGGGGGRAAPAAAGPAPARRLRRHFQFNAG